MNDSIQWQLFPKSREIPDHLKQVVSVFERGYGSINSGQFEHSSNAVLNILADDLTSLEFKIERSKTREDKIRVPVLFGRNGALEKSFDADGFNPNTRTVIEIEAGRAVANNQFLKDLFQACMMHEVDNLVVALRNSYKGNQDFETVVRFFDTLYASGRLTLPLKHILIVGY